MPGSKGRFECWRHCSAAVDKGSEILPLSYYW